MTDEQKVGGSAEDAVGVAEASERLDLQVEVKEVGPCKKHISVTVPAAEIARLREETVADLAQTAVVPGFRAGKAPEGLLARRFRKEIAEQLTQKLLLQSLEQVTEEHNLDPINEPDVDFRKLEVPEDGDFDYSFNIEVRPEFTLPDFKTITINRYVREITDEDVASSRERYLSQFGQIEPYDGVAETGDYVVCDVEFTHNGSVIREMEELTLRIRPTLRFWDAEIADFDKLMVGAKADDVRELDLEISQEAAQIEMRLEKVHAKFTVLDVKRLHLPEFNEELSDRIGIESQEKLDELIRDSLTRQVSHSQREKTRDQLLEKITESAAWDLPEGLVHKHTDNALRREILEMQQAGYSRQQVEAREAEIRQQSLSSTKEALKQHFILDKIASENEIDCTEEDITMEVMMMAYQEGASPRKLRARLVKTGMIENLEAQIRERKAVDFLLGQVQFEDVPLEDFLNDSVEGVKRSITTSFGTTEESEVHEHDHDGDDHDHDHDA